MFLRIMTQFIKKLKTWYVAFKENCNISILKKIKNTFSKLENKQKNDDITAKEIVKKNLKK